MSAAASVEEFIEILNAEQYVDLQKLQDFARHGIQPSVRGEVWLYLLGVLSADKSQEMTSVRGKYLEYERLDKSMPALEKAIRTESAKYYRRKLMPKPPPGRPLPRSALRIHGQRRGPRTSLDADGVRRGMHSDGSASCPTVRHSSLSFASDSPRYAAGGHDKSSSATAMAGHHALSATGALVGPSGSSEERGPNRVDNDGHRKLAGIMGRSQDEALHDGYGGVDDEDLVGLGLDDGVGVGGGHGVEEADSVRGLASGNALAGRGSRASGGIGIDLETAMAHEMKRFATAVQNVVCAWLNRGRATARREQQQQQRQQIKAKKDHEHQQAERRRRRRMEYQERVEGRRAGERSGASSAAGTRSRASTASSLGSSVTSRGLDSTTSAAHTRGRADGEPPDLRYPPHMGGPSNNGATSSWVGNADPAAVGAVYTADGSSTAHERRNSVSIEGHGARPHNNEGGAPTWGSDAEGETMGRQGRESDDGRDDEEEDGRGEEQEGGAHDDAEDDHDEGEDYVGQTLASLARRNGAGAGDADDVDASLRFEPDLVYLCAPFVKSVRVEVGMFFAFARLMEMLDEYYALHPLPERVSDFLTLFRTTLPELYAYFEEEEVDVVGFASSWLRHLLAAEMRIEDLLRLWDSYFAMAEPLELHMYVCIAVLANCKDALEELDQSEANSMLFGLPNLDVDRIINEAINIKLSHQRSQMEQ